MQAKTIPVRGPMPGSDAWKAMRKYDPSNAERPVVFGASVAAEACGLSPYGAGPLDVFMKYRDLKSDVFEGNDATEFGQLVEPLILTLYERRENVKLIRDLPMYLHPTHSFLGATPDSLLDNGDQLPVCAVDAKSATFRLYDATGEDDERYGQEETDQVPRHLLCQAQVQCEVLGVDRVDFPVLFDRKIRIYRVHRDEAFIAMIVSAEKELAERIINNDPPEPNWTHPQTKRLLSDLYGYQAGKAIDLDHDDLLNWNSYEAIGQAIKELEAKRSSHRNQLLAKLQDAELGRLPAGKKELRRCVVADSIWTDEDLAEIAKKIGTVKRKGHERLLIRKVK